MSEPVTYRCREIVDLVTEYLEGGLTTEERLGFERHVAICPPCRAHLAQLRRIVRAAPALSDDELPPSLRAGLSDAFAAWTAEREEP